MMIRKISMLALLAPLMVSAEGNKFVWQPVTQDIAGNAITVMGYIVSCGNASGSRTIAKPVGNVTEAPINAVVTADGVHYCVVQAENADGKSAASSELRFFMQAGMIRPLVPAAPVGFEVR